MTTTDQPVVEMPAPQVRERRTDGLPGIPIAIVLLIVFFGSAATIVYGAQNAPGAGAVTLIVSLIVLRLTNRRTMVAEDAA